MPFTLIEEAKYQGTSDGYRGYDYWPGDFKEFRHLEAAYRESYLTAREQRDDLVRQVDEHTSKMLRALDVADRIKDARF